MTRFIGPNGGTFSVTAGVAITQEYIDAQVKAGEWTPVETPPESTPGGEESRAPVDKPLEKRTVSELKAHATEHGIDLGGATKKPDILAAIIAAQDDGSDGAPDDDQDADDGGQEADDTADDDESGSTSPQD